MAQTFTQLQNVVHESTVGVGLVNPNDVAKIVADGGGEEALKGKNPAVIYATRFFVKANDLLASLEEETQAMLDQGYAMLEFLSETELAVNEVH